MLNAKRSSLLSDGRAAALVLATGAVMTAAGGWEIWYGSGYIQLERGWSAFIGGTVLLTGGLLTAAVGLVLRSLAGLRVALAGVGASARPDPYPSHADAVPLALREQPIALHAVEPPPLVLGGSTAGPEPLPAEIGIRDAAAPPAVAAGERFAPPAAHVAAPDLPVGDFVTEGTPAMDDWLDRSFADLGRQAADRRGIEAEAASRDRVNDAVEPVQTRSRPAVAEPDLVLAEAAAPPPPSEAGGPSAPRSPEPAVIGRYESDGTSYVMYADGSIEAQSEAGIYRFASMAELKAFIET